MHIPAIQTEPQSNPATKQGGAFFGNGGKTTPFFQPKLTVNQPGDAYEQEADAVADAVMRMREGDAPAVQRMFAPRVQRACAHCEEKRREEAGVQRKESSGTDAGGQSPPSIVSNVLSSGGGQSLDAHTQQFMGSRMGMDFSDVRIHTGDRAAESALAIQARAYTSGNNVVFGKGEYQPGTDEGKRLLAHELVHVGQQGGVQRMVQRDVIFGSGYSRPYANDNLESASAQANKWTPSSTDFRKTATDSGGGSGVKDFSEFLTELGNKADGSIRTLHLVGHANSSFFSFGGKILVQNPPDVDFQKDENGINSNTLASNQSTIAGLRKKFAKDASIILVGCHAGTGKAFLDSISTAFQVCVKGFKDEVKWCIEWNLSTKNIFSRGRVLYLSTDDPSSIFHSGKCADFNVGVSSLTPDNESCAGVVKPTTDAEKK